MQLPSITEYLESFSQAEAFANSLSKFRFERDFAGRAVFVSGNYAVALRMTDGQRTLAVKCFTRHSPGRAERYRLICERLAAENNSYVVPPQYLDNEIYVFDQAGQGRFYPVVVSSWIEGHTLDHTLQSLLFHKQYDRLVPLAEKFDRMALWLLASDFAHGDLKPENIMVSQENELSLVDYDGMFTGEMAGSTSCECGSPAFRHPLRDHSFFNRHIDDYAIALISVSLHALADDPSLYARHNDGENIILDPARIFSCAGDPLLDSIARKWFSEGRLKLYRLCELLHRRTPVLDELEEILGSMYNKPGEKPVFDFTDRVCENLKVVCRSGRYGFADPNDNTVIDTVYDMAHDFCGGKARVRKGREWFEIDRRGQIL